MLILVWLLSFNPYAVLVAGQNLVGRCCSPMNQSSVNMVATDDNSLSFQCLGSIFWGQTKCWMNIPSSGPHLPAMFPRIEHATMQLPVSFPQQWLCEHGHFRIVSAFLWGLVLTVAVYRSHYMTHTLVLAKYVKLPLWKRVLTLS